MHRFHPHHHSLVLLLLLPLLLPVLQLQGCVEEERQALLEFKRAALIEGPFNFLESWNSSSSSQEDCCGWNGITCRWDGGEGHVIISLDLSYSGLSGKISPSLLSLKHLEYLDLSLNDFQGTPIPAFIGNFSNLTTLNLSGFGGAIPPQLGMLRNLEELDLSQNQFRGIPIPPFIGSLQNLTSLDLSDAGFGGPIPPQLGMLRNLQKLKIDNRFIDSSVGGEIISHSPLYVQDFRWISNLSSLHSLHFQNVDMGRASDWELSLSRCPLLQQLTLESCNLTCSHHSNDTLSSPGNGFASLESLDLSHNKLGESFIPTWIFSLKNLTSLNLKDCSLDAVVTEHHFRHLASLHTLDMSNNPLLRIQIDPDWISHLNLSSLHLSSCQLGPAFPLWIRTQENLGSLNLSSTQLHDSLPTWIWDFSPSLFRIDLSQNQLYNVVPDFHNRLSSIYFGSYLDLSSNNFSGQFPARLGSSCGYLNLSHNSFSGSLSQLLCHERRKPKALIFLDIDNNLLSGNMSECWGKWEKLKVVSIRSNNLIGPFPNSLINLVELTSLHLRDNHLSGTLTFLEKHTSTNLVTLDLGINQFTGPIPTNIGDMSSLRSLDLSMNRLSEDIPQTISELKSLDHLNVSYNNLTGKIPVGVQLQTFNSSSYIGNALCGKPLATKCDQGDEHDGGDHKGVREDSRVGFYVGFGASTSSMFIILLFRHSWRITYFRFLEKTVNKLF